MTITFYLTISAMFWDFGWITHVPTFDPVQRVFLFIFLVLFTIIDMAAIYEFFKEKE